MPVKLPLEFPAIYRGQFALIDSDHEERAARYSWGIRTLPGGKEHVVGRKSGERTERALSTLVTERGFRFTYVNGDPTDCRIENLRCMNPRKYRKKFGDPYPGPTSEDPGYLLGQESVQAVTPRAPRKNTFKTGFPGYSY